jgi:hypothetical protein
VRERELVWEVFLGMGKVWDSVRVLVPVCRGIGTGLHSERQRFYTGYTFTTPSVPNLDIARIRYTTSNTSRPVLHRYFEGGKGLNMTVQAQTHALQYLHLATSAHFACFCAHHFSAHTAVYPRTRCISCDLCYNEPASFLEMI